MAHHAHGNVSAEGRITAAGAAGQIAGLYRAGVELLAVINQHLFVVGNQNFLGTPTVHHACSLITVGQAGQNFSLSGIGLEKIKILEIYHDKSGRPFCNEYGRDSIQI